MKVRRGNVVKPDGFVTCRSTPSARVRDRAEHPARVPIAGPAGDGDHERLPGLSGEQQHQQEREKQSPDARPTSSTTSQDTPPSSTGGPIPPDMPVSIPPTTDKLPHPTQEDVA